MIGVDFTFKFDIEKLEYKGVLTIDSKHIPQSLQEPIRHIYSLPTVAEKLAALTGILLRIQEVQQIGIKDQHSTGSTDNNKR